MQNTAPRRERPSKLFWRDPRIASGGGMPRVNSRDGSELSNEARAGIALQSGRV